MLKLLDFFHLYFYCRYKINSTPTNNVTNFFVLFFSPDKNYSEFIDMLANITPGSHLYPQSKNSKETLDNTLDLLEATTSPNQFISLQFPQVINVTFRPYYLKLEVINSISPVFKPESAVLCALFLKGVEF